jgi:hypothetical protein
MGRYPPDMELRGYYGFRAYPAKSALELKARQETLRGWVKSFGRRWGGDAPLRQKQGILS